MRTFFRFILFLFSGTLCFAQDTTLPTGNCTAYLASGKTIRDIRLWKINGKTLEYQKNESLHDIPIDEIDHIQYRKDEFVFSDSGSLNKVLYDGIITSGGDTINCFIKEIGQVYLRYTLPGQTEALFIYRSETRGYTLKGEPEEVFPTMPIDPKFDFYELGKRDGKKEFKGNGSLAGGMVCGVIPVLGWLVGPITMAVPPNLAPSKKIFYNNPEYRKGYKQAAHVKKVRRTFGGMIAGVAVVLLLLL